MAFFEEQVFCEFCQCGFGEVPCSQTSFLHLTWLFLSNLAHREALIQKFSLLIARKNELNSKHLELFFYSFPLNFQCNADCQLYVVLTAVSHLTNDTVIKNFVFQLNLSEIE